MLQRIICPFGLASRADVGPRANNKGAGTNRFVLRSDESLCAYACHSSTLLEAGAGVAVGTAETSSQKYACAHAPRALINEHRPSLQAGFKKPVVLFKTGTVTQKNYFCIFRFRSLKYKKPDPVFHLGPDRKREKIPKTGGYRTGSETLPAGS